MLRFRFNGADGCMVESETLTSGMVGKKVKLEFSRDWDNLTKTAVFTAGSVTRDAIVASDVVTIPAEVLATPMQWLYVSIYGVGADGVVMPTARVKGPEILPGAYPSGDAGTDPELPVWAQIREEIAELEVPTKTSQLENDSGFLTEQQLDADKLPEAISDALAQARKNGEFDGEDGVDGITPHIGENGNWYLGETDTGVKAAGDPGPKGENGANGVGIESITRTSGTGAAETTDTYTITYTDGSTSTYSVYNGKDGADGAPGTDGYTPVKGVDYYTDEEKAAFESYIATELAKRGQMKPEFASSVDECADTSKLYVLPDGYIYAYMETTVAGGTPLFTNLADPESADWMTDYRFSSSSGSTSACTGAVVSNAIAAKKGDVIRIKGLRGGTTSATQSAYFSLMGYSDEAGTIKAMSMPITYEKTIAQHGGGVANLVTVVDGVTTHTLFRQYNPSGDEIENIYANSIVSIRVSGEPVTTVDDIIVTINEEIAYSADSTGYAWRSTGHAFVPADYEDRIVELEGTAADHEARVKELEELAENGLEAVLTDAERLEKIRYWDKPVYDGTAVTLLGDDRTKAALTTSDRTIDAIYAKYRALMAQYPNHITETNLGPCTSSDTFEAVDILRFDIKEPDGLRNSGNTLYETKPKIILLSGIHHEWVGVWGLYYAIEEIVTNPAFDDVRRNAHIIVIPCANPYGLVKPLGEYSVPSHVNANGVAPHNNFEVDWVARGAVGEYNYSGTAPLSELETQYADKVMSENPDAVAFISCHNNDYDTEYGAPVIWASSATAHMCNVVFRLIDKISKAWLDKYGDTLTAAIAQYKTDAYPEWETRLGRAQFSTSSGTEAKQALKYGIQGVNVEISRMMYVFSGDTDGSSEVMTHGAEVYANLMRTLLAVYDCTDKDAYYK